MGAGERWEEVLVVLEEGVLWETEGKTRTGRSLEGPRAVGDGGGVGRKAQSLGDLGGRKGGLPTR